MDKTEDTRKSHKASLDRQISALADPEVVGLSRPGLEKIGHIAEKLIEEEHIAGAVTIVARHGKVAHFEAKGSMDIEAQIPMGTDTIFRIASMSKPFAAVATMMLFEEGLVDLDSPASIYLPELGGMQVAKDPNAERIELEKAHREMTVRDLMRHTSGLPGAILYMNNQSNLGSVYRDSGMNSLHECDLEEMLKRIGTIPLYYHPGEKWHYSISADVLGRLVEVVSGKAFDEFLSERIFTPLEMVDTGFYVPEHKIDRIVKLYGPAEGGGLQRAELPGDPTVPPRLLSAGGGLCSTALDYMKFCLMLSGLGSYNGTQLMRASSVREMTQNQLPEHLVPIDKTPSERYEGLGFGLGVSVRVDQTDWVPASQIGEYGWIGGASTEFWISPKDELVTIVLTQKIPFASLSEKVKSQVYAARIEPTMTWRQDA